MQSTHRTRHVSWCDDYSMDAVHAKCELLSERLADVGVSVPGGVVDRADALDADNGCATNVVTMASGASTALKASSAAAATPAVVMNKKMLVGQRLKTALRVPPSAGRLVQQLKTASASRARYLRTYDGHADGVWHAQCASNGADQWMVSASADGTARVWALNDIEQKQPCVATVSDSRTSHD